MSQRFLGCLGVVAALVAGCGGSGKSNGDGGVVVKTTCTANATSCLNDHVSLTCTSDGTALIGVPCADGQICTNGACATDPNAPCTAAQDTCQDATTALQCASTGKGFNVVTCPANTACQNGVCYGADAVGATYCNEGYGSTTTTTDGYTYTSTPCATGTLCVDVYDATNVDHATCLPADCTPPENNCGPTAVCGSPNDATVSTVTSISECTQTALGWKWVTSTCQGGTTCSPYAYGCGSNHYAACTGNGCIPGQKTCFDGGIVTCGSDGQYDYTKVTSCASNTLPDGTCIDPGNGPVCGDPACADISSSNTGGVCDSAGKFHVCKPDFTVDATATACTSGACIASGNRRTDAAGNVEGACVKQCQDGDQRCVPFAYEGEVSAYQVCANGVWGAAQNCANSVSCWDTLSNENRPAIYCGACLPGNTQCSGVQIQTCDNTGNWGTAADCTLGVCQTEYNGATNTYDGVCRAQCVPGQQYCTGNDASDPTSGMYGSTAVQTCSATGILNASTDCPTGQLCRVGPSSNGRYNYFPDGQVLGCVVCVGTKNAFGLPDTRCTNATGDATSPIEYQGYTETCKADSSGWDATTITACVDPNPYCFGPSEWINLDVSSGASTPYPAFCSDGD